MGYRVTAPYVVVKYIGTTGSAEVRGFYEGAILPDTMDDENLKHHVDSGLVKKVETAAPVEPEPLVPPADQVPAGNASQQAWADYAMANGASPEDVKDLSRDELRELYG